MHLEYSFRGRPCFSGFWGLHPQHRRDRRCSTAPNGCWSLVNLFADNELALFGCALCPLFCPLMEIRCGPMCATNNSPASVKWFSNPTTLSLMPWSGVSHNDRSTILTLDFETEARVTAEEMIVLQWMTRRRLWGSIILIWYVKLIVLGQGWVDG